MVTVELLGLSIVLADDVYEPAEDSLLLAEHVDAKPRERVLDIGTGTGLAALVAARGGGRVVATDIHPVAGRLAHANARLNGLAVDVVLTDLARGVQGPFDLVLCNPPYLPTVAEDRVAGALDRALSGGADGARVVRRVLSALPGLLAKTRRSRALIVASSLQPVDDLRGRAAELGLAWNVVDVLSLSMEQLYLVRVTREVS